MVEIEGILFLSGRKLASGSPIEPKSVYMQDKHWLVREAQESQYMVPIISPSTALGVAVAETVHDEFCGSSPASSMARASRYFYFTPSAGSLFQTLQDKYFKCRRIRMIKGTDLINPLRHLSDSSMIQGVSLQLDIAGPFLLYTTSKQWQGETRGVRQANIKMWILLAIDYFTSRLEVSPLEDLTTASCSAAINKIISTTGWHTRKISIDPGSSLITGVK